MTRMRSAVTGATVVALVSSLFWLRTYADTLAQRDVPVDVIARAQVGREHMRRIVMALAVYENDYSSPPPTLSLLYPRGIDDPQVFWHPGDNDPPPTTIDNDIPNAPNSARISFDVDLSLYTDAWCFGEAPCIRDNTSANNGGWFINELYGMSTPDWYTMPPGMMPTPLPTAVAASHLRGLAQALGVYANDNYDCWPTDPLQLVPYAGPPCSSARNFWHPGDDQPMPTEITNAALDAPNSAQISFEYLVAGLSENDYDPNLACFRDISPAYNGGCGRLTAYCDGHVSFDWLCPGDLNGDGRVDWADGTRLAAHWGQTCGPCEGDYDGDQQVTLADFAELQQRYGSTCP